MVGHQRRPEIRVWVCVRVRVRVRVCVCMLEGEMRNVPKEELIPRKR